jgi:hypothetical protein
MDEKNGIKDGATGLIAQSKFCSDAGIDPVTAWRYVQRGWLRPVKLANRVFFRASDLAEFERRAVAGEFARPASGAAAQKQQQRAERLARQAEVNTPTP